MFFVLYILAMRPVNPGSPGKWALKRREREREIAMRPFHLLRSFITGAWMCSSVKSKLVLLYGSSFGQMLFMRLPVTDVGET